MNTTLIFSISIHYTRLLLYICETLFRLYPSFVPCLGIGTASKRFSSDIPDLGWTEKLKIGEKSQLVITRAVVPLGQH
jgi:hypothetical protein